MFTDNFIKLMQLFAFCDSYGTRVYGFKKVNGTTIDAGALYLCYSGFANYMKTARCGAFTDEATGSSGVYFGSGYTPAQKSDYKLESQITSGLSITNSNVLTEHEKDGQYTLSASYAVKNTSDAEINISEIGLFSAVCTSTSDRIYTSTDTRYPILVERTVLTEPITIPAGKTKIVTYKITFNQTLNVE